MPAPSTKVSERFWAQSLFFYDATHKTGQRPMRRVDFVVDVTMIQDIRAVSETEDVFVNPREKAMIMKPVQLIYASTPFGYDELTLAGILSTARFHNKRNGITGSLICRSDLFLQILEGEAEVIKETYSHIKRDARHIDVVQLGSGEAEQRLFADWDMRHDVARSWMWTRAEVKAGAVRRATPFEALAIFQRLAAEPYQVPVASAPSA